MHLKPILVSVAIATLTITTGCVFSTDASNPGETATDTATTSPSNPSNSTESSANPAESPAPENTLENAPENAPEDTTETSAEADGALESEPETAIHDNSAESGAIAPPANPSDSSNSPNNPNAPAAPNSPSDASENAAADAAETVANADVIDCDNPITQMEINHCAYQDYAAADAELNQTYQRLKSSLDAAEQELLTEAELAWIEYRDHNCALEAKPYEGGSIQPTIRAGCLTRMTEARTAEMQQQLEGQQR